MSRRQAKVRRRSPSKLRRQERRARQRDRVLEALALYRQALVIGVIRERVNTSVVCDTCGLEQDYRAADEGDELEPCARGDALGIPCAGETCVTAAHWREDHGGPSDLTLVRERLGV